MGPFLQCFLDWGPPHSTPSRSSGPLFDEASPCPSVFFFWTRARPTPPRSSGPPFDGAVSAPSSVFWNGAHPTPPLGGSQVDAILTRRPLAAPNLYFEEMCLSLYIHMTMRGTQNCSWLKVGAIGETCGKWCMGEFCKLHSYRMRGGSILPKPCRKCGQAT